MMDTTETSGTQKAYQIPSLVQLQQQRPSSAGHLAVFPLVADVAAIKIIVKLVVRDLSVPAQIVISNCIVHSMPHHESTAIVAHRIVNQRIALDVAPPAAFVPRISPASKLHRIKDVVGEQIIVYHVIPGTLVRLAIGVLGNQPQPEMVA
jgi:hypothetical protein